MPAAIRRRLRLVMCTSTARSSCVECSSASSGAASAAAARGSLVSTGTGSLETSSLCTTTRSGPSSGSTSKRIAAAERCVKETRRVVFTRTAPPVGERHSTTRVSTPARQSSRRSWRSSSP